MDILATQARSVAATDDSWQAVLKAAFRHPSELAIELQLPMYAAEAAKAAHAAFRLFAPRPFVDLIEPGEMRDPLLLQIWPSPAELQVDPAERRDPVGDSLANSVPGVLHKYSGRALLVLSGACAVHCRYCFRRHWPYDESPRSLAEWEPSLAAVEADRLIEEIILSGGDPMMWEDGRLSGLVERVARIGHVRRLRVHTRMPVVVPQRVTSGLLQALSNSRLQSVIVLHANHARELSDACRAAVRRFVEAGMVVLNQSVLLAGVNADADTLIALSERLIECRVLPYYLHQLDRVTGSKHFEVSVHRGRELIAEMRRRLPGYMVPRYVREQAGEAAKTILA